MKLTAKGIAKFHFWGTYSQTFHLLFDAPDDALLALPHLQKLKLECDGANACGTKMPADKWRAHGQLCSVFASGADIERIEAQLTAMGADSKAIGSLAHSCDHGDPFSVTIEVEDPAQILISV